MSKSVYPSSVIIFKLLSLITMLLVMRTQAARNATELRVDGDVNSHLNSHAQIPVSIVSEWRTSTLGNRYLAQIPHDALGVLIEAMPIYFHKNISESLHTDLSRKLKDALPQRINHEVLQRILILKNFGIEIFVPDESFAHQPFYIFSPADNILSLSIKCFVDEVWMLMFELGKALSLMAWKTIPGISAGNLTQAEQIFSLVTSAYRQDYHEWSLLFKVASAPQANKNHTKQMSDYAAALLDWQPQFLYKPATQCATFMRVMQQDVESDHAGLVSYTHKTAKVKVYVPKITAPYYSDKKCPSLMFPKKPPITPVERLTAFVDSYNVYHRMVSGNAEKQMAFIDAHPSKMKLTFFPSYCKTKTEAMQLQDNYCGEQEPKFLKKRVAASTGMRSM